MCETVAAEKDVLNVISDFDGRKINLLCKPRAKFYLSVSKHSRTLLHNEYHLKAARTRFI